MTYNEPTLRKSVQLQIGTILCQSDKTHHINSDETFNFVNPIVSRVNCFFKALTTIDEVATLDNLSSVLDCNIDFLRKSVDETSYLSEMLYKLQYNYPEEDVQTELTTRWFASNDPYCCAFDSHHFNGRAPFFKLPSSNTNDSNFTNSAKPDYASLVVPMYLELKPATKQIQQRNEKISSSSPPSLVGEEELNVILQAFERVHASAFQSELLRRIFSLATTGSRSWLVYCHRSYGGERTTAAGAAATAAAVSTATAVAATFPDDATFPEEDPVVQAATALDTEKEIVRNRTSKVLTETYYVIPIATEHVFAVWRAINHAALRDPSYYLHRDTYFIRDILSQMSLDIAYCRVKMIARSGSIVYGISVSQSLPGNVMSYQQNSNFAIKVHSKSSRGTIELKALDALKGCHHAGKYVLGTFCYNIDGVLAFDDFRQARLDNKIAGTVPAVPTFSSATLVVAAPVETAAPGKVTLQMFRGEAPDCIFSIEHVDSKLMSRTLVDEDGTYITHPWWIFKGPVNLNPPVSVTHSHHTRSISVAVDSSRHGNRSNNNNKSDNIDCIDSDQFLKKRRIAAPSNQTSPLPDDLSPSSSCKFTAAPGSTAILMYMANKSSELPNDFTDPLWKQLREMHLKKVLHTDLRMTNILTFALPLSESNPFVGSSTNNAGGVSLTSCITDFDLAVVRGPDAVMSDEIELDISAPGARKDLILMLAGSKTQLLEGGQVILWNTNNEVLMLDKSTSMIRSLSQPPMPPRQSESISVRLFE